MMTNLTSIYFEIHLLLSVILLGVYIVFIVINKDELEEKAQSYALKASNLITVIALILYILYKSMIGNLVFSQHILLIFVNILCVLYLIFNFLYLKGITVSFNIKNVKVLNIICYISTVITVILIITGALKVKLFELSSSIIRLDTLLMMLNFIFISLIIGLYPRKKLSRQEYKEVEATSKKFVKTFTIGYGLFFISLIGYVIFRFYTK